MTDDAEDTGKADSQMPEGAAFFKALANGAIFKWMELVSAGASEARLDAQSDLASLLKAVAKKAVQIEEMDGAPSDTIPVTTLEELNKHHGE